MKTAIAGDYLEAQSIINTSSNSSCKLLMPDKTIVDIGPSTLFKIDKYTHNSGADRESDVSIDYGKIRASVTQPVKGRGHFNVRTQSATMGVRGTEFYLKSELNTQPKGSSGSFVPGKTEVLVTHGTVEFAQGSRGSSSARPVALTAGMQLSTTTRAPGSTAPAEVRVSQASPEQLQTTVSETKQQDPTFMQAVKVETDGEKGESRSPSPSTSPSRSGSTMAGLTETLVLAKESFSESPKIAVPGMFSRNFGNENRFQVPSGAPVTVTVKFSQ
jgi:hypothetical protein